MRKRKDYESKWRKESQKRYRGKIARERVMKNYKNKVEVSGNTGEQTSKIKRERESHNHSRGEKQGSQAKGR